MKQLASLAEIDWITIGTKQVTPHESVTVAHCIPPVFPAYAKLFHPIYEDLAVQGDILTWQDHEKAASSRNSHPKTSIEKAVQDLLAGATLVYGGAGPEARPVRLRWAEVAQRLGLPFSAILSPASFTRRFAGGSWPRNLIGPEEGNLAAEERDALASILGNYTKVDRCFFHFWFLATVAWENDILFEGRLDEMSLFPKQVPEVRFTPTHWFPEDHGWLVHTSYDLASTLIGGSESLVGDLITNSILECLPVTPETRVDYYADLNDPIP